jgi:hypothetical protein
MSSAVRLRTDFTAGGLRWLAKKAEDVNQSRRLLSLAAVLDGMSRAEAAMVGGHGPANPARLGPPVQCGGPGWAAG